MTSIDRDTIVRAYQRYAPIYNWMFGRLLEAGRIEMAKAVGAASPDILLEVGVGTGLALPHYPADTPTVGVDLSTDMSSYRVSSLWQPSENLSWHLVFENFRNKGTGDVPSVDFENRVNNATAPGNVDLDSDSFRTRVDYEFDSGFALAYVGGYAEFDQSQLYGNGVQGDSRNTVFSTYEATQHEIQLLSPSDSALTWTAGLFYFEEDNSIRFDMLVSFVVALTLKLGNFGLASWQELLLGVGITTICWVSAAFLTPPADPATLRSFCERTNPGGPGWKKVYASLEEAGVQPVESPVNIPRGILCMLLGCSAVYGVLFGTGFWLYGQAMSATVLFTVAVASAAGIVALRFND